MVRIKSILNKINKNKEIKIEKIVNEDMENILVKIVELSRTLKSSYDEKTLNYITDYLYDLCSLFNKFYSKYSIINEKDEQIKNILCKYSYEHWSIWHHIFASKILLNDELNFDVEHRLYLNTDLSSIHEIMKYYLEKCFKYNIPFYFKYCEQTTRNDCIVIYTNTDNLAKNIEILREIKKEHPELSSRIYYPPILTGPIDEWIGYGSEPKQQITNISFNEKRSEIIYPIIEKVTKIWYEKTFGKTDLIGY